MEDLQQDEATREIKQQQELAASLRGEVGRLSEQLRLVGAERDEMAKQAPQPEQTLDSAACRASHLQLCHSGLVMCAAKQGGDSRLCQVDELRTELSATVQSHKDESTRIQTESSAAVHSQKEFARKQIEQVQEEYKELVASLREALGEEVTTRAEVAKLCDEIRVLTADRDNVRRQANERVFRPSSNGSVSLIHGCVRWASSEPNYRPRYRATRMNRQGWSRSRRSTKCWSHRCVARWAD